MFNDYKPILINQTYSPSMNYLIIQQTWKKRDINACYSNDLKANDDV